MHCYVRDCPNYGNSKKKDSELTKYFPAPEDNTLLEKWRRIIPAGDKLFSLEDKLCDLHFLSTEVLWFTETKLPNGNVRRLLRDEPILRAGTIPSIFPPEKHDTGKNAVKSTNSTSAPKPNAKSVVKSIPTPRNIPATKSVPTPKSFLTPKSVPTPKNAYTAKIVPTSKTVPTPKTVLTSKTIPTAKNLGGSKTLVPVQKEKNEAPKSSLRIRLKDSENTEKTLPKRVKRRSTILEDYVTDDELNQVHGRVASSSKKRKTGPSELQPVIRLVPLECLMDKKVSKNHSHVKTPVNRPSSEEIDIELQKVIEIPLLTTLKQKKSVSFKSKDTVQFKQPKKTVSKAKLKLMANSSVVHAKPNKEAVTELADSTEVLNEVKMEVPDIEEELARMEMDENNEDMKSADIITGSSQNDDDSMTIKSEEVSESEGLLTSTIKSEDEEEAAPQEEIHSESDHLDYQSPQAESHLPKEGDTSAPVVIELPENSLLQANVNEGTEGSPLISESSENIPVTNEADSVRPEVADERAIEGDSNKEETGRDKEETGEKLTENQECEGLKVVSGTETNAVPEVMEVIQDSSTEQAEGRGLEENTKGIEDKDNSTNKIENSQLEEIEKTQSDKVEVRQDVNEPDESASTIQNYEEGVTKGSEEGSGTEVVALGDLLEPQIESQEEGVQIETNKEGELDVGEKVNNCSTVQPHEEKQTVSESVTLEESKDAEGNTEPESESDAQPPTAPVAEQGVEDVSGNSASVEAHGDDNSQAEETKKVDSATDEPQLQETMDQEVPSVLEPTDKEDDAPSEPSSEVPQAVYDNQSKSKDVEIVHVETLRTDMEDQREDDDSDGVEILSAFQDETASNGEEVPMETDEVTSVAGDLPSPEDDDNNDVDMGGEDREDVSETTQEEDDNTNTESIKGASSEVQQTCNEDEIDIEAEVARLVTEVGEGPEETDGGKDEGTQGVEDITDDEDESVNKSDKKEEVNQCTEIVLRGNSKIGGEITASGVQNLFSPETIQEILKQIKLPLTTPVTLRIAPLLNSPSSSSPTKSRENSGRGRRGRGRGGNRQLTRNDRAAGGQSSSSSSSSSINLFRQLTKTRTVYDFATFLSDIEDEVQYWKLCQIIKESFHELIESRNTKTSVGRLTLSIGLNRTK